MFGAPILEDIGRFIRKLVFRQNSKRINETGFWSILIGLATILILLYLLGGILTLNDYLFK